MDKINEHLQKDHASLSEEKKSKANIIKEFSKMVMGTQILEV